MPTSPNTPDSGNKPTTPSALLRVCFVGQVLEDELPDPTRSLDGTLGLLNGGCRLIQTITKSDRVFRQYRSRGEKWLKGGIHISAENQ